MENCCSEKKEKTNYEIFCRFRFLKNSLLLHYVLEENGKINFLLFQPFIVLCIILFENEIKIKIDLPKLAGMNIFVF